jgi:integrase
MQLTAKRVAMYRKRPGRYHDGHGLILVVVNPHNASWQLRYQRNGRERWLGLGPLHTVTLKDARERARAARLQLLDGTDPIDARRAERAKATEVMTFKEAAEAYNALHEQKWHNAKHRKQFLASLACYAYPVLGNTAVSSIDTAAVLRVVEPIWLSKTETASRVRGRIESVLDWATVRGYRSGDNPARWKGHLAGVLPAPGAVARRSHYPALPWAKVAAFMAELRMHEGVAARALEFTILTAARTGEVVGARWSEIDLETDTWIIPAARMKSRREHRVPLSPRSVELLSGLFREAGNSHVFIGARTGAGLGNMAMPDVLQQMEQSDVTVHGFRSTFRDWAAEATAYPNHVVEQALAHTIGNAVEAAYRRGDLFEKRRHLMNDWAQFCGRPTAGAVVALRQEATT